MRVLIVEDERELATIVASVLEEERFDVDLAFDGADGLDKALSGNYDVIVLDRLLPERRGGTPASPTRPPTAPADT